jgi:hypothetical protein
MNDPNVKSDNKGGSGSSGSSGGGLVDTVKDWVGWSNSNNGDDTQSGIQDAAKIFESQADVAIVCLGEVRTLEVQVIHDARITSNHLESSTDMPPFLGPPLFSSTQMILL